MFRLTRTIGLFFCLMLSASSHALEGDISSYPLNLDVKAPSTEDVRIPNIMLLLDNSGSMCEDLFWSFFSHNCGFLAKNQKLNHLKQALNGIPGDASVAGLISALQNRTDGLPEVRIGLATFAGKDTSQDTQVDILVPIRKLDDDFKLTLDTYECKSYTRGGPVIGTIRLSDRSGGFFSRIFSRFTSFFGFSFGFRKAPEPEYTFYCPKLCPNDPSSGSYAISGFGDATACRTGQASACKTEACVDRPKCGFFFCRFFQFWFGSTDRKSCQIVRAPAQVDCAKDGNGYHEVTHRSDNAFWAYLQNQSSITVNKVGDYMKQKVEGMTALGGTPLAKSLAQIGRYYTAYLDKTSGNEDLNFSTSLTLHPDETRQSMRSDAFFTEKPKILQNSDSDTIIRHNSTEFVSSKGPLITEKGYLVSADPHYFTGKIPLELVSFNGCPNGRSCWSSKRKESIARQRCEQLAADKSAAENRKITCEWYVQDDADAWNRYEWDYFYDDLEGVYKKAYKGSSFFGFGRSYYSMYNHNETEIKWDNEKSSRNLQHKNFRGSCRKGSDYAQYADFRGTIDDGFFGSDDTKGFRFNNCSFLGGKDFVEVWHEDIEKSSSFEVSLCQGFFGFFRPFPCVKRVTEYWRPGNRTISGYTEHRLRITLRHSASALSPISISRKDDPNTCGVATERAATNNHIILLTDGDSTEDKGLLPVELRDYLTNRSRKFSPFFFFNFFRSSLNSEEFIIDVANAIYDIDLQPGNADSFENARTHMISFGSKWNGFFNWTASGIMQRAARAGGGYWSQAGNNEDLFNAFKRIVRLTRAESEGIQGVDKASLAAPEFSTLRAEEGSVAFQPLFRSFPWLGDVLAYAFVERHAGGDTPDDSTDDFTFYVYDAENSEPIWSAAQVLASMDKSTRQIFTLGTTSGIEFKYDNLSSFQKLDINRIGHSIPTEEGYFDDDAQRQNLIHAEQMNAITLQELGDIIHAQPVFYENVLYVAANDGMLHAFDARNERVFATEADANSDESQLTRTELFAYIPSGVFSSEDKKGLHYLTEDDYLHRYYVDMAPAIFETGGDTVLVGTLGAGGKSIYALSVRNPINAPFEATDVLWEKQFEGLSFSEPQLSKLSGSDILILGSGFPETDSQKIASKLYGLNPNSGATVFEIDLGTDGGLGTPAVVDLDRDGNVDRAYAGDMVGNLHVIGTSGKHKVLFQTPDGQQITAQPGVATNPEGGKMILFGTGRYLYEGDVLDSKQQYFFAIEDPAGVSSQTVDNVSNTVITKDDLVEIELKAVNENGDFDPRGKYLISRKKVGVTQPADPKGWFISLLTADDQSGLSDGANNSIPSERSVYRPHVLRGKYVLFVTIRPEAPTVCERGGFSRMVVLQAEDGLLNKEILDLDNDQKITDKDRICATGSACDGSFLVGTVNDDVNSDTNNQGTKKGTRGTSSSANGTNNNFNTLINGLLKRTSWREIRR